MSCNAICPWSDWSNQAPCACDKEADHRGMHVAVYCKHEWAYVDDDAYSVRIPGGRTVPRADNPRARDVTPESR